MEIDKDRDLIVNVEAKIMWRSPTETASEQIMRDTINHQVRAMGNRLEHSVATIIKSMSDHIGGGSPE